MRAWRTFLSAAIHRCVEQVLTSVANITVVSISSGVVPIPERTACVAITCPRELVVVLPPAGAAGVMMRLRRRF